MLTVEDRLTAIESELAKLRRQFVRGSNWITKISGSMKDYPEFDEVLRLGREARQSDNSNLQNGENGK